MTTRKKQDYALYKGDELLDMGTAEEIAARRGVKPETIYYYATASQARRHRKSPNGRFLSAVPLGVRDEV